MDLAGYVINAVLVEGQSVKEVCAAHDISRNWLYELIARYRQEGEERASGPSSKRPRSSPTRVALAVEDKIVALRKALTDLGRRLRRSHHRLPPVGRHAATERGPRWPPSGESCPGEASSSPNPRSGPTARGAAGAEPPNDAGGRLRH